MPGERLPQSFFDAQDTISLARQLLGCELVHESADGVTSGIIVECEAYLQDDPACHAFNRRTARTEPMYSSAGTIYVYLIYGMYQCFNIVSNREGIGEAVLIRALQPTQGVELMEQRRSLRRNELANRKIPLKNLCSGPGKLVAAMGISRDMHNNISLQNSPVYVTGRVISNFEIVATSRIGISVGTDLPYRFYIKGSNFVSKR